MKDIKKLVKIANKIQSSLAELQHSRWQECAQKLNNCLSQLEQLNHNTKRFHLCLSRGWISAASKCGARIFSMLHQFSNTTLRSEDFLKDHNEPPNLWFLLDELKELRQEYGSFSFEQNRLSVVTEPITLEGIYLGPFQIQLDLSRLTDLYRQIPYVVIALDPHPATTDETVTHPHVNHQQLCEGDGAMTIRLALEQGRLCHFFNLVRSILNTYNPDSPYVAIQDWQGIACRECGYVTGQDRAYFCEFCEFDYCDECVTYCRGCDLVSCINCVSECPFCGEYFCPNCIGRCPQCQSLCCENCRDENLLCLNCSENQEDENEQEKEQSKTRT